MHTKKKMLYLTVCDPDLEVTGATVRIGAFVKYLARYYDISLIHMTGSGHDVDPEIESRFADRGNRLGVTRRHRVAFSRPGYFLFSPALYRTAKQWLQRETFNYILADYGLAATYGTWLSRRTRTPLIYSSHNLEYRMYLDLMKYDKRRAVLAPYIYAAERAACRTAQLVVAISDTDACAYRHWIGPERIEVIPQGFDPEAVHPYVGTSLPQSPVALFVGSFRDVTNREAARRIAREIAPEVWRVRPDTQFQLIGADPPMDLQQPRTNLECLGFVDDLRPYWQRAQVVLAPMTVAHGMATKIITALAYGKTVLTSPQGAGSIPRHYRQLRVAPLNAFATQLIELLDAPPLAAPGDFDALCNDFGWPSLIDRLYKRIERDVWPV